MSRRRPPHLCKRAPSGSERCKRATQKRKGTTRIKGPIKVKEPTEVKGPHRGATTAEKLTGTKVLVRKGVAPFRREGPEYHPRKIFENSDAKSCILVTTCCEISCFWKTMAKKLGAIHCWSPT